jgi:uncharacterized protein (DUF58 family)
MTSMMAQTKDLELVIRHVLAGLGHGMHAGRERGAGVEFSEYRAYAPGDEWRRVDWKLLARADRYYVREAERDSHVATWLWLDATASMAEPSRSIEGLDKLWFARTVLACVAAIAQRQGDAFGLVVCSGERSSSRPPRADRASCSACWRSWPRPSRMACCRMRKCCGEFAFCPLAKFDLCGQRFPGLAIAVERGLAAPA